jgi:hypothetical protein
VKIAFVTDIEGRWDKLVDFCEQNPWVSLVGERLELQEGATFVYGGDTIDRGPSTRRLLATLVEAKVHFGDRVILLAGNRDINKLRLPRELGGHPRVGAPEGTRAEILKWTFERTMGASGAWGWRGVELGDDVDDDAVVDSFLADLEPDGMLWRYLSHAQLAWRGEETLVVHGAVTEENLGVVPDVADGLGLDAWIQTLNSFYVRGIEGFRAQPGGVDHHPLVQYQAPLPGTRANARSVVYARPVDALGNAILPTIPVQERLRAEGITRVVVGHTPAGETPAVVRDAQFELIVADNSYGHLERGAQVLLEGPRTRTLGWSQVGEAPEAVRSDVTLGDESPIGSRGRDGRLVKGTIADGRRLLFRFLPGFVAEETVE